MKSRDRILYFDLLNILACFCVIALHCNGIVHSFSNTIEWYSALVVECICYWAVPVFLMLSGATLVHYRDRYSTKCYIVKRIKRVVIPWLLWSIISLLWKVFISRDIVMENWTPIHIVQMVVMGQIESKYWFFMPLFSVYLGIPFLKPFLDKTENQRILAWMAISYLILNSFIPVMSRLFQFPWNSGLNSPWFNSFFIFPILGVLLAFNEIPKKWRIVLYGIGACSVTFRYVVTVLLSLQEGNLNRSVFDYTQFHSILLACAVFVFFKHMNWSFLDKWQTGKRSIKGISACSFGIYLIHAMVMQGEIMIGNINVYGWKWRLIGPFLTYLIALCLVWTVKKVPGIRKIMP